jgi:enterochelin esterase-like enzyme
LLENLSTARPNSLTNLIANRHLRDVLEARGFLVRFKEINGGHDFFPWQATLADGLIYLTNSQKEEKLK